MAVSRGKLTELLEADFKRPQMSRRKDYTYDAIELFSGISLAEYKPKAAQMIGSYEDDLCKTSFKEMNVQVLVACVGSFIDEHMVRMEKTETLLVGVLRMFVLMSKHKGHNIEQQKKKAAAVAAMASSGGCRVLVPGSQDEQAEKRRPGRPKKVSTLTQILPTIVNPQIHETHRAPHPLQPATGKTETERTVTRGTTQQLSDLSLPLHTAIASSSQRGSLPQPSAVKLSEPQALILAVERYDEAQQTIKFLEDERVELFEDLKSANTQLADSKKHSVQLAAECGRLQAVERSNKALIQKIAELEKTNAALRTQCSQYLDLYKDSNRKRKRADSRADKERHKRLMQTMRFGDLLEGCKTVFDEHKEMILHGSESDGDESEAGENRMDIVGTDAGRGRSEDGHGRQNQDQGQEVAIERHAVDNGGAKFEAANHRSGALNSDTDGGMDDSIRTERKEAEKQDGTKCGTAGLDAPYTPPIAKDNEHTMPRSPAHNSSISTGADRHTAVSNIVIRNDKEDECMRMGCDVGGLDGEHEEQMHENQDKSAANGKNGVTEMNGKMDTGD